MIDDFIATYAQNLFLFKLYQHIFVDVVQKVFIDLENSNGNFTQQKIGSVKK
jgi:hypothetical protein